MEDETRNPQADAFPEETNEPEAISDTVVASDEPVTDGHGEPEEKHEEVVLEPEVLPNGGEAVAPKDEASGSVMKKKRKQRKKKKTKKKLNSPPEKAATAEKKKKKVVVSNGVAEGEKPAGMIFMCNSSTKKDCYRYKVMGLPAAKKYSVAKVYKGMKLFLFDVDLKMMYGIYRAQGGGSYNIVPEAFGSAYPSQVKFTVLFDCLPLEEERFKPVIKDNYFARNKFRPELTTKQVNNLCKVFRKESRAAGKRGEIGRWADALPVRDSRMYGPPPAPFPYEREWAGGSPWTYGAPHMYPPTPSAYGGGMFYGGRFFPEPVPPPHDYPYYDHPRRSSPGGQRHPYGGPFARY